MSSRKILVFGDSHTEALKIANQQRASTFGNTDIRVLRLSDVKSGKEIGDVSLDAATSMAAESTTDDLIASTTRANAAYGELALQQLEAVAAATSPAKETA